MTAPCISVIIDSYNSSAFIGEAIKSVLAQTQAPDEVIIADASTDDSPAIIGDFAARDGRIKPVFVENRGQLSTILAGTEAAMGDWVFILDGDDAFKPDHLEKRLQRIHEFPEADVF
jgi:glycosyltransferase involved in cell wall biosynthesis